MLVYFFFSFHIKEREREGGKEETEKGNSSNGVVPWFSKLNDGPYHRSISLCGSLALDLTQKAGEQDGLDRQSRGNPDRRWQVFLSSLLFFLLWIVVYVWDLSSSSSSLLSSLLFLFTNILFRLEELLKEYNEEELPHYHKVRGTCLSVFKKFLFFLPCRSLSLPCPLFTFLQTDGQWKRKTKSSSN